MKRIISFIILISFAFSLSTSNANVLENHGAEVVSFALYKDGEKVLSSEDNGIYPIGSLSKTFTAALIISLSKKGLLHLDTPIVNYLPEFSMADERDKDITLRMLLNHTAGLFGSTLKNSMLYKEKSTWNHDNILNLLKDQRLKSAPGEIESYSNDGYTLLEIVSERVTEKSYTELLHSELDFLLGGKIIKTAWELEEPPEDMVNSLAAGGLYGNADALCVFANKLSCEKEIIDIMTGERINKKPLETFGLGWDNVEAYPFGKYGIKALTKGGDTLSYHTALVTLPEMGISASYILKGGSSILAEAMAVKMITDYLLKEKNIEIDFYEFKKPEETLYTEIPEEFKGVYISNAAQYSFDIRGDFGVLKNLYTGAQTNHKYLGNGVFDAGKGIISFVSFNDELFMTYEGIETLSEKEKYSFGYYLGVKKEAESEIPEHWKERNGKVYFVLDEAYNSGLYMTGIPATNIYFAENIGNYLGYMKLAGSQKAMADISLPGAYGRDLTDIEIFIKEGKEYLKAQGWMFLDSSAINNIYNGEKSLCTILPDGYARWFKSGEAKGKKISAELTGKGMFALFNSDGLCVYSSLSGQGEAKVPENGYVLFAGEKGTVFNITLN